MRRSGAIGQTDPTFENWLRQQVEAEKYWFHRQELLPGLVTPGWSDPAIEKLPFYGMPDDLDGLRVLDIGCAEGFFSFEAERRGAAEVVAIDSFPDSVRRFNLCRAALGSKATAYLCNVYDLSPRSFGTFDLVLFYGVLYHLRHPLLALEKILSVCRGTMLLQTAGYEEPAVAGTPWAKFHPHGVQSGPSEEGKPLFDPTVFWLPNRECVRALTDCAGFEEIETLWEDEDVSIVLRARSPKATAPVLHWTRPSVQPRAEETVPSPQQGALEAEREDALEAEREARIRVQEEWLRERRSWAAEREGWARREKAWESERAELESRYHEVRSELGEIHHSKMWRLWMLYLAIIRGLLKPIRWLARSDAEEPSRRRR